MRAAGRIGVQATAEIIDLRMVRERRKGAVAPQQAASLMPGQVAWVPVWFFAPVWMCMPAPIGVPRDG